MEYYSIHVPGWLLKWLDLITAPGSVSNQPGSVTWLATKYLKTVSLRNHTEKLTTLWSQNISFGPKINVQSSYFTILMPNCLENTFKLQFLQICDSCQILDLINFQNNLTWLDSNIAGISLYSRLKYSQMSHRYAKNSQFIWFLYWKRPIDIDFIHFICQLHQFCGINDRDCFFMVEPVAPQLGMLGALIVWWPAWFWWQWAMAEGTVHAGCSPEKFPTKPTED